MIYTGEPRIRILEQMARQEARRLLIPYEEFKDTKAYGEMVLKYGNVKEIAAYQQLQLDLHAPAEASDTCHLEVSDAEKYKSIRAKPVFYNRLITKQGSITKANALLFLSPSRLDENDQGIVAVNELAAEGVYRRLIADEEQEPTVQIVITAKASQIDNLKQWCDTNEASYYTSEGETK